jgi:hypothetical protein
VSLKCTDKNVKQPNCFWLSMHAYRILTIADLIRAKSICSQTQFSHIINRLLTTLVRSVLWNIRPLIFAWTSLLRRSVHTKKPRSNISQYRNHARSISRYYNDIDSMNMRLKFKKFNLLLSKNKTWRIFLQAKSSCNNFKLHSEKY